MREMKDSGFEWIGEIPVNWEVDKLKFHLKRNEPRNPGDTDVLSLYRELGVIPKDSRDDNHNVTSEDTSKYKYVQPGDFVINKMKAWQGSVAVSEYEGIVSPAYFIYKFTDDAFYRRYFQRTLLHPGHAAVLLSSYNRRCFLPISPALYLWFPYHREYCLFYLSEFQHPYP